tara:strand:- start:236 stop:727 length:492 start_codon:yes stop_codon:yes gene_type:complete
VFGGVLVPDTKKPPVPECVALAVEFMPVIAVEVSTCAVETAEFVTSTKLNCAGTKSSATVVVLKVEVTVPPVPPAVRVLDLVVLKTVPTACFTQIYCPPVTLFEVWLKSEELGSLEPPIAKVAFPLTVTGTDCAKPEIAFVVRAVAKVFNAAPVVAGMGKAAG